MLPLHLCLPFQTDDVLLTNKAPYRTDFSLKACDAQRKWVELQTGTKLTAMGQWLEGQDSTKLHGNIEQPMGLVKVPVAPVGPLKIKGEAAYGDFIAPFATTEGALVASAMRGVTAINAGPGVFAWTSTQHATRGPCFITRSPREALMLGNWTKNQKKKLQEEVVRKVSHHAMLEEIITIYDMEVGLLQPIAISIVLQYCNTLYYGRLKI